MKQILIVLSLCLVFSTAAKSDVLPFYGSSTLGPSYVNLGNGSSGSGYCQFVSTCTINYQFMVSTPTGYFQTDTSNDTYYTYHNYYGSFGQGGSINILFSDGSTLSGYLLWANASGYDTGNGLFAQYWDYSLGGAFIASALSGPMWGGVSPGNVGGTFSLNNHYPHSPMFTGPVSLSMTTVPEPASLACLASGLAALIWIFVPKRQ